MPFEAISVMDQRLRFVADCLQGELPMTTLGESYGISRQSGYTWLARYRAEGPAGLVDRSRAPRRPGNALAAELADAIVTLRRARPHWGPKKLKAVLAQRQPEQAWPAASTIGDLLQRRGLVIARRRRRGAVPTAQPFPPATAPNQRWCIDFKGWFRTRDGQRCDPLTLTDAASRPILALEIVAPTSGPVEAAVDRLLHEHGLPERLLMDNGPPFASSGAGGLTRLSVKWLKLGIGLERITPGCPQQNGRWSLPSGRRSRTGGSACTGHSRLRRAARGPHAIGDRAGGPPAGGLARRAAGTLRRVPRGLQPAPPA